MLIKLLAEATKGRENRGPQGRYNSLLCPEDGYLQLVAYTVLICPS